MTDTKGEILQEGTEWETIQFRKDFSSNFSVWHKDTDGDVEFEMEDGDERIFVHLNQEDIRLLIAHLQKQLFS